MKNGFIKLWRKSLDGGMMTNHKLWAFWCWCLLKASHKECSLFVEYQQVKLEPGQFVFGRKVAAEEIGMSEKSVRTCLAALVKYENLSVKKASNFSIITISNWNTYQVSNMGDGPPKGQQGAGDGPARGWQGATNKNGKNDKNGKNKTKDSCPESDKTLTDRQADPEIIFITLPLNDKTTFKVTQAYVDSKKELYPAVDVEQEFRSMKDWLDSNPSKRKTRSGIKTFCTRWLIREQNSGGRLASNKPNARNSHYHKRDKMPASKSVEEKLGIKR